MDTNELIRLLRIVDPEGRKEVVVNCTLDGISLEDYENNDYIEQLADDVATRGSGQVSISTREWRY